MTYSFAAHLARYGPDADYPVPDLAAARSYCARLMRTHYENFTVASALLPRRLVTHFYPIYAWCRWADDLGDETGGGQRALDRLGWWRQQLQDCFAGKARHPVLVALQPTIARFAIPSQPFLDLLSAFEQDQRVKRYFRFDDLLHYCKHSANPVGRLVLYLCESFNETTAALSDEVCTGLQLANFWQDIRRDYLELDRVYLPDDDRRRFGYDDADLRACRFTPQFRDLMCFEVERARGFFNRGSPLLDLIPADVRVDIALFIEGGRAILRKIEAIGFDVWNQRPKLSKKEKMALLLKALKGKGWSWLAGNRVHSTEYSVPSTEFGHQRFWGSSAVQNRPCKDTQFGEQRIGGNAALQNRPCKDTECSVLGTRYSVLGTQSPESNRTSSLPASYAYCHRLTRHAARNFYYAFQVLPRRQRRAMDALYAFMRITDDLADEAGDVDAKRHALNEWRQRLERALAGEYSHPAHPALHDVVRRFNVPAQYLHDVIDGVMMDLEPVSFARFDDLYVYCYRVASAVGLACIHIWGFSDPKAKEYAEAAGIALQLTNILRDLAEDLRNGRVYLPQEDLVRFTAPPESWGQISRDRFRNMMRFQVERARGYYQKAEVLCDYLTPSGRAVFQIMSGIYRGLLEEIERRDYDVFSSRVRLSRWRKLRTLLWAFPVRWGWL